MKNRTCDHCQGQFPPKKGSLIDVEFTILVLDPDPPDLDQVVIDDTDFCSIPCFKKYMTALEQKLGLE